MGIQVIWAHGCIFFYLLLLLSLRNVVKAAECFGNDTNVEIVKGYRYVIILYLIMFGPFLQCFDLLKIWRSVFCVVNHCSVNSERLCRYGVDWHSMAIDILVQLFCKHRVIG